ncbi:hypothetical protein TNCV_1728711 [Trichonephila clavipes]|nr:hypothetical protein TNCV_1728711 [Trichonephila clavipes]
MQPMVRRFPLNRNRENVLAKSVQYWKHAPVHYPVATQRVAGLRERVEPRSLTYQKCNYHCLKCFQGHTRNAAVPSIKSQQLLTAGYGGIARSSRIYLFHILHIVMEYRSTSCYWENRDSDAAQNKTSRGQTESLCLFRSWQQHSCCPPSIEGVQPTHSNVRFLHPVRTVSRRWWKSQRQDPSLECHRAREVHTSTPRALYARVRRVLSPRSRGTLNCGSLSPGMGKGMHGGQ